MNGTKAKKFRLTDWLLEGILLILIVVFSIIANNFLTIGNLWNNIKSAAINTWNTLCSSVTNIVSNLKNSAVQGFNNMLSGIRNTLTNLPSIIRNGFSGAISYITSLPRQALSWGRDLVNGIANGIWNAIYAVRNAVSNVAGIIRSYLHFSVPDVGPLTEYESWMPDFMKGLAEGMHTCQRLKMCFYRPQFLLKTAL